MLKKLLIVAAALFTTIVSTRDSEAGEYVHGYFRSNGTYVAPHFRSHADGNFWNNYSTYPNINPYTGSIGTHHYPSYSSGLHNYGYQPSYSNYGSHYSGFGYSRSWGW